MQKQLILKTKFLNVPESFNYSKLETDEVADYYEEFFSLLGEYAAFYYIGKMTHQVYAIVNDQDKLLEPIIKKIEKNFS